MRLDVTVTIDTEDILDVIGWARGDELRPINPDNRRWLIVYESTPAGKRDALWQRMPASLQWALNTLETDGESALRKVLTDAAQPLLDAGERYVIWIANRGGRTFEIAYDVAPVGVGLWRYYVYCDGVIVGSPTEDRHPVSMDYVDFERVITKALA